MTWLLAVFHPEDLWAWVERLVLHLCYCPNIMYYDVRRRAVGSDLMRSIPDLSDTCDVIVICRFYWHRLYLAFHVSKPNPLPLNWLCGIYHISASLYLQMYYIQCSKYQTVLHSLIGRHILVHGVALFKCIN